MSSLTLRERLTGELSLPTVETRTKEAADYQVRRSTSRLLELFIGFAWECEADASSVGDWSTANALGQFIQEASR